jgi:hypothetical protein
MLRIVTWIGLVLFPYRPYIVVNKDLPYYKDGKTYVIARAMGVDRKVTLEKYPTNILIDTLDQDSLDYLVFHNKDLRKVK